MRQFWAIALLCIAGCISEPDAPAKPDAPAEPAASAFTGAVGEVGLMTVAPGHFHAGLVHKYAYGQIDPVVHVYAPPGPDLDRHLAMVQGFNNRADAPTDWQLTVYRGEDYLERMLAEHPGNVMVAAGNNAEKIGYVERAVAAGINVLADKPMVIDPQGFARLEATLARADSAGLVVADIMTERHEITSILQRELARDEALFGTLAPGTPEDPAITKVSEHFLSKIVAGSQLVRPAWFLDARQQGEAIVDVSTHLVDLILWQAFPEEGIDYRDTGEGLAVLEAERWSTDLTPAQFSKITQTDPYPAFLQSNVDADSVLSTGTNGAFTFTVRGVHARVEVRWGIENPGGGDTHFSRMRGTGASLVIRQNKEQQYRPTLYVEPGPGRDLEDLREAASGAIAALADQWPGLALRDSDFGLEVVIPEAFREGHEEHFASVTRQYLASLVEGSLPDWERTNLLTKYYVTSQAFTLSQQR